MVWATEVGGAAWEDTTVGGEAPTGWEDTMVGIEGTC